MVLDQKAASALAYPAAATQVLELWRQVWLRHLVKVRFQVGKQRIIVLIVENADLVSHVLLDSLPMVDGALSAKSADERVAGSTILYNQIPPSARGRDFIQIKFSG